MRQLVEEMLRLAITPNFLIVVNCEIFEPMLFGFRLLAIADFDELVENCRSHFIDRTGSIDNGRHVHIDIRFHVLKSLMISANLNHRRKGTAHRSTTSTGEYTNLRPSGNHAGGLGLFYGHCVWQRFSRHFGCPVPTIWQKSRRCLRFPPSRASRPCPSSCSCR